jgi:signal transduction histidine kinase
MPALGTDRYLPQRTLRQGNGVLTILATDRTDGAKVVVKCVGPPVLESEAGERLTREAAPLRALNSPHLAPILELSFDRDHLRVVTQYVPGITLEDQLRTARLQPREAIAAAGGMLRALAHLHGHGLLHGGLRPANIVLQQGLRAGEPLTAVLLDSAVARSVSLVASPVMDQIARARYFSPEQAGLIARDVDGRSDLYALGVVLFECLAGHPPFEAGHAGDLFRQHLSGAPASLREAGLGVPDSLDQVVQRLLQKDPDDRYQSGQAVGKDLELIAAALDRGVAEPHIVVGAYDRRHALSEPALTGRDAELRLLTQHLQEARFGRSGLVLIDAESGGGKTRLLDEFCRRAEREGARVLRGQGVDRAAPRPLQVLTGVAADLLARTRESAEATAALRDRIGAHAATIRRTLPELEELLGPTPGMSAVGTEEYSQSQGVEALVALLDALGSPDQPAVVVLDDCQWIDELSVRVLLEWQSADDSAATGRANVLILVAARVDELPPDHALRTLTGATRIELKPLTPDQIRQVVESMAGQIPAEAFDVVLTLSGGSPFMVLAVLRGLVESEALAVTGDGWRFEPSTDGVQASRQSAAFLTRRLELLGADSRRLLTAGAVLGRDFDLGLAAVLAEQSAADARIAIAPAVHRNLVWHTDGLRIRFVHDRLREAFLSSLTGPELAALHRRAAEAMEAEDPERAFELSYHFDAGWQADRALPYAITAAESARARNDLELAERQYRIAERGAAGADPDTRRRILVSLGQVLMLRGAYDEAGGRLESALTLADGGFEAARIQGELGELAFKRDDLEDASRWIEQALRMLRQPVPRRAPSFAVHAAWELMVRWGRKLRRPRHPADASRELLTAHLYARLLYAWFFSRRSALATAWVLIRQVNAGERCPPSRELAHAYGLYGGGMAVSCPLFARRGLRYVDRALAMHQERSDPWGEGHALSMRTLALYAAGKFEEGARDASGSMQLLKRSGDPWELYWAGFHRALCLYRLGDLEGAIEQARVTHHAAVTVGDAQAEATTLEVWARATAGQLPPEVLGEARGWGSRDIQAMTALLVAEAVCHHAAGRHSDAIGSAERAVHLARRSRTMNAYLVPALPLLATLYREALEDTQLPRPRRRLRRRCVRAVRRARRYARVYRNERPHALREGAVLAALRGRSRTSRRLFALSLADAERQQARAEQAETLLSRARIGLALGWPTAADDRARGEQIRASLRPADGSVNRATLGLAERFDALLAAGRPVVSAGSSTAIAQAVKAAAVALLRPETCWVVTADARRDVPADHDNEADLAAVSELIQRAARELRPVLFVPPPPGAPAAASAPSLRSGICAPIVVDGEVQFYVLAAHSRVAGLFGDEEIRVAEFITHLAGSALEREQLQDQTRARVVGAQEAERARVARDLHDDIGQSITSVMLGVNQIRTEIDDEPLDRDRLRHRTEDVQHIAGDALERVQRLAFELRPSVLDDLGLVAAMRRLITDLEAREHLRVDLAVSHLPAGERLPPNVETTAYRVAQEALTNVLRHAGVQACSVVLARVNNRLRLVVSDAGAGFDGSASSGTADEESLGLRGMSERATLAGGTLRITSAPGAGTMVVMEIPLA